MDKINVELSYKELVMISTALSHLREHYKSINDDDMREEVVMLSFKINELSEEV